MANFWNIVIDELKVCLTFSAIMQLMIMSFDFLLRKIRKTVDLSTLWGLVLGYLVYTAFKAGWRKWQESRGRLPKEIETETIAEAVIRCSVNLILMIPLLKVIKLRQILLRSLHLDKGEVSLEEMDASIFFVLVYGGVGIIWAAFISRISIFRLVDNVVAVCTSMIIRMKQGKRCSDFIELLNA